MVALPSLCLILPPKQSLAEAQPYPALPSLSSHQFDLDAHLLIGHGAEESRPYPFVNLIFCINSNIISRCVALTYDWRPRLEFNG